MKYFIDFIRKLNIAEKKKVLKVLSSSRMKDEDNTVSIKLFNYIAFSKKNLVTKRSEIAYKLFRRTNSCFLKTAQSRIKSTILDTLASDSNIEQFYSMEPLEKISVKLRKRIGQLKLLYTIKGYSVFFQRSLNYLIKYARMYEIYPVYLDALMFKISIQLNNDKVNNKKMELLTKELENAQYNYMYLLQVQCMFSKLNVYCRNEQHISCIIKEYTLFVKQLEQNIQSIQSANVRYFYFYFSFYLYTLKGDAINMERLLKSLKVLVENSVALKSNRRFGIVSMQFAYYYANNARLVLAKKYLMKAKKYFNKHALNHYIVCEHLLFISLYNNELNTAKRYLVYIQSENRFICDFINYKYRIFEASILFKEKFYKKCIKLLNENNPLFKDKIGWNNYICQLLFMCYAEMVDEKEADKIIKQIEENMKELRKINYYKIHRIEIILKLMKEIRINKIGFAYSGKTIKKHITTLKEKYKFIFFQMEILCFEDWVVEKVKKYEA
jgi:hypothetical protein